MPDEVIKYVRHSDVPAHEECGWIDTKGLEGTHHGFHSTLMKWPKEEPPQEPKRV